MSNAALRIMTYNTHHSAGNDIEEHYGTSKHQIPGADYALDLPRVADVISALNPDIVALQEVDRFWARSAYADQTEEFANLLQMDVRFGANVMHEADDHASTPHEYGVATLSRHPINNHTHRLLPTTTGWEQRGMLDTRIDVPGIGKVAIINTHLQVGGKDQQEEGRRQRIQQSQFLANYLASLDMPVIVLGDFNTERESGDLAALIGEGSSLVDVWEVAGKGTGETIFNGAHGEATARIDYILVSPHFNVISAEVIDNEVSRMASDHFPLIAELGFTGTPGTPEATDVLYN